MLESGESAEGRAYGRNFVSTNPLQLLCDLGGRQLPISVTSAYSVVECPPARDGQSGSVSRIIIYALTGNAGVPARRS